MKSQLVGLWGEFKLEPEAYQLGLIWPDQYIVKLVSDPVPNTDDGRQAIATELARFIERHGSTTKARFLVIPAKSA